MPHEIAPPGPSTPAPRGCRIAFLVVVLLAAAVLVVVLSASATIELD